MRSAPDYIQFYPTFRCNLACGFCFNKNVPMTKDMPLENFRVMLGKLKNAGVRTIDIIGGEPTLHRDIVAIVRESEQNGFRVNVSSNGTDLETLAAILASTKKTAVGISINDRQSLARCAVFIRKHRPVVKTVFSRDLDRRLVEEILALHPERFYLLFRDAMSPDELGEAVPFDRFVRTVAQNFEPSAVGTVFCSGFLPNTENYPDLAHVRCPAGTTKLGVMPDGSVYPCNLFFGKDQLRLGNILSDPFGKIWGHPALAFFRTYNKNACPRSSCKLHARCYGGCPAHSLVHAGVLTSPDPRCCPAS